MHVQRPILLVSNSIQPPASLPPSRLKRISFSPPAHTAIAARLGEVAAAEGLRIAPDTIQGLSVACQGDLRQAADCV